MSGSDAEEAPPLGGLFRLLFCDHPLFVKLSGHVNDVVAAGLSDFIMKALLLSLRGDFGLCTVQCQGCRGNALCEAAERNESQCRNCNESSDGFHGHFLNLCCLF